MPTMNSHADPVRSEPFVLSSNDVRASPPRIRRWTSGLGAIALLFGCAACESARAPSAPSRPTNEAPVSTPPDATWPFRFVPPSQPAPNSPTDPTVGRYTLDLVIGSDCAAVPEGERHRTYTADIDSIDGTTYVVRLYDAVFLDGSTCNDARLPNDGTPVCNRFLASRTDDSLVLDFSGPEFDDFNGNLIYERLSNLRVLEMAGHATGPVQGGMIAATGSITASYWRGFPGVAGSSYSVCQSASLRMIFARK